ncbi:HR1 repeat Rho-binding protein, partial [Colletotrichum tofieldiae]
LDMMRVAELEANGVTTYSGIVSFYEKNDVAQMFYGPSNCFKVEMTTTPDAALWVVDATDSDKGNASSEALISLISNKQLQPRELLVVVINKMDSVDWSEQVFMDFANTFSHIAELTPARIGLVPVSALDGDNILDYPSEIDWIMGLSPSNDIGKAGIALNVPLMEVLR